MDQHPAPELDPGTDPGDALEFDAEAYRAAVRAGAAQADAGETVPHEAVRAWLLALARGERHPPPSVAVLPDPA